MMQTNYRFNKFASMGVCVFVGEGSTINKSSLHPLKHLFQVILALWHAHVKPGNMYEFAKSHVSGFSCWNFPLIYHKSSCFPEALKHTVCGWGIISHNVNTVTHWWSIICTREHLSTQCRKNSKCNICQQLWTAFDKIYPGNWEGSFEWRKHETNVCVFEYAWIC